MTLNLVAYGYVEPNGSAPTIALRQVSSNIAIYLTGHMDKLVEKASGGTIAYANFSDDIRHAAFERLRNGTDEDFLEAAQSLANSLCEWMDGRTKRGFFVALRRTRSERVESSVLKLDIHDEIGAAARRTADGDLTLEAVEDLLDLQGELEKGAVFPDRRDGSQIVVGDKVSTDSAKYFLEALGVRQSAKPKRANRQFMSTVYKLAPAEAPQIAEALSRERGRMTPEEFFSAHEELVSASQREGIVSELSEGRHPVTHLVPERLLKKMLEADGIVVSGPVGEMEEKVRVIPIDTGWQVVIEVQSEPRPSYE